MRARLENKGYASKVIDTMLKARRDSSNNQYESYLKQFSEFCPDSISASVQQGLSFLQHLLDRGLSYSALNSARSALSTVINVTDGTFGDQRDVSLFMKGVFNLKPPVPRYRATWDANDLLSILKPWAPIEELNLRSLTKKVCCLLLITTCQRLEFLYKMNVPNIVCQADKIVINFDTPLKHQRVPEPFIIEAYKADISLCPVHCLKIYLQKTKQLRTEMPPVFIVPRPPYSPASRDTLSRWLKETLQLCNVDTNKYTAHSYRAAATSAKKRGGGPTSRPSSTQVAGEGNLLTKNIIISLWRNNFYLNVLI